MLDSVTADSIFAEINMDETRADAFLLVEGPDENAIFFGHVSKKVVMIVCGGKRNVLGAARLADSRGNDNVYGLIDSDFDRIPGQGQKYPGRVIATNTYDLISDLVMSSSAVLRRTLGAHAPDAVRAIENIAGSSIEDLVFALTSKLAAARLATLRNGYPFVFKNYNFAPLVEDHYASRHLDRFLECAACRDQGFEIDETVLQAVQDAYSEIRLTRHLSGGHDIVGASVALLRKAGVQVSARTVSGTLIAVATCQVLSSLECLTDLSTIAREHSGVELFDCFAA